MDNAFPAVGNRYLVNFGAFRVILSFTSTNSLTYTVLNSDGSEGQVETVAIKTEPIGHLLFLVTWQERDKTTVVHVENYERNTIVTNITNPDHSFTQFHGTFERIEGPIKLFDTQKLVGLAAAAPPLTFANDIAHLFRPVPDVSCMKPRGVLLDNSAWMCTPANAQRVYDAVESDEMPKDGPWPPGKKAIFKQWMDEGCKP